MRVLAEYVMKGRTEAVIAAVLATGTVLFAWVGAAVVALVTLRRGAVQGAQVLAWALLPAGVLAAMGDTGPVTTLLGATLVAAALRATNAWSWALLTASASGLLVALLMVSIGQGYSQQVVAIFGEVLTQLAEQATEPEQAAALLALTPNVQQVAGLLGMMNALSVALCLVLARWWQALLYNPGGFRTEFHQLRLTPQLTILLIVVGLLLSALGADYRLWATIVSIPFMFAGFALIHGVAAKKQLSGNWLGFFYIAWLFVDPLKALLLILAVVDSWIDFRGRLAASQPPQ